MARIVQLIHIGGEGVGAWQPRRKKLDDSRILSVRFLAIIGQL
jgi:hypothetical protein